MAHLEERQQVVRQLAGRVVEGERQEAAAAQREAEAHARVRRCHERHHPPGDARAADGGSVTQLARRRCTRGAPRSVKRARRSVRALLACVRDPLRAPRCAWAQRGQPRSRAHRGSVSTYSTAAGAATSSASAASAAMLAATPTAHTRRVRLLPWLGLSLPPLPLYAPPRRSRTRTQPAATRRGSARVMWWVARLLGRCRVG
jgi:hypothetical protein